MKMKLRNVLYGLISLPLLCGCEENLGRVSVDGNVVNSVEADSKPKKDQNYLEGIVVEEFGDSSILKANDNQIVIVPQKYILKVDTEQGIYTFEVRDIWNDKPSYLLAVAIEKGDKIRFPIKWNCKFDEDRIGWCHSNEIRLLENGKSTYSGPAEQEKK